MSPQVSVTHVAGSTLVGHEKVVTAETIRFGRHPDNDVAFDPKQDVAVSSFHAEMTLRGGTWYLTDLNSQNGTFINDRQVTAPQPVPEGARIRFGEGGPMVLINFSADSAPRFVGQNTMAHAIDQVIERERQQSKKRLLAMIGVGTLATLLFAGMVWIGQRSLEGEQQQIASRVDQTEAVLKQSETIVDQGLAPITERMQELHRKHAAAEADFERLTVSIRNEQDRVAEIESRSDLSESARQEMLLNANAKLTELAERLSKTQQVLRTTSRETDWPTIVEPYLHSIFLCYYDNGAAFGIGTAFVIDAKGVLATNGHVADAMLKKKLQLMIENVSGKIFTVEEVRIHPEYNGTAGCPDLALVRINTGGASLTPVVLGDEEDLRSLKIGAQLGTMGFPGELLYEYSRGIDLRARHSSKALATFKDGWVGQITDFDLKPAPFEQAVFIQHSASVSHGTSGSPLFNTRGRVVAVNNSGRDIQFLGEHSQQGQAKIAHSAHPAEISRAIRIDVLRKFREQVGW